MPGGGILVLDACVLLNLYATDRLQDAAAALGVQFAVVPVVAHEALFLRAPVNPGSGEERVPVDLAGLRRSGCLVVQALETDTEKALFIELAAEMHDGEAASCALSLARRLPLATDDSKVLRLMAARHAEPAPLTTPDLLFKWFERSDLEWLQCSRIIRMIERRASYRPPGRHPLHDWWRGFSSEEPDGLVGY